MTLKKLYMDLSKIIDDSSKTNPDILDKPIVFISRHVVIHLRNCSGVVFME